MLALFDLSFKKFVSPTIAKIVYILVMIGIAVGYLGMVIAAFNEDTAVGFVVLFLGPLFALVYLCVFRVMLEALIAMIMTAQNTGELLRLQQHPGAAAAQQGGYAQQTPPGHQPGYFPPQQ